MNQALNATLIDIFWALLSLGAALVCLSTIAGFLGRLWWRFDLFSHFRAQYAFLLATSGSLFLVGQRYPAAILSGLFALINLGLILPLYLPAPASPAPGKVYRILLSNVLRTNPEHDKISRLIQSRVPDFIVLLEADQPWLEALSPTLTDYPYLESQMWENNYGLSLFSRYPFQDSQVHFFGEAHVPTVVAHVELDGERLTLIGTHPPPPKSAQETRQRDQQMALIAQFVRAQPGQVILLGDINMTSWSPTFRDFLQGSGLRDSRQGFGTQPTWPTHNPFFLVPIDHALVSPRINVQDRRLGPRVGSDHRPVILDFSITSL